MEKPIKTFEETLAEEMRDPEFREGFLLAGGGNRSVRSKENSCRASGSPEDASAGRNQASGRVPCAKRPEAD